MPSPLPARAHSLNSVRSCSCWSLVIADVYSRFIVLYIGLWISKHFSFLQHKSSFIELKRKSSEFLSSKFISSDIGVIGALKRYAIEPTPPECFQAKRLSSQNERF